jgi:hypothetical protein
MSSLLFSDFRGALHGVTLTVSDSLADTVTLLTQHPTRYPGLIFREGVPYWHGS